MTKLFYEVIFDSHREVREEKHRIQLAKEKPKT